MFKKENHEKLIYSYSLKDDEQKIVFSLIFTVDKFSINNQLYIENEKARILVEAEDLEEGKKEFSDIINTKVRESIAGGYFFDLVKAWNLEWKDYDAIVQEKRVELIKHNQVQELKEHVTNELDINMNAQFKYSSAMINRFDEVVNWANI